MQIWLSIAGPPAQALRAALEEGEELPRDLGRPLRFAVRPRDGPISFRPVKRLRLRLREARKCPAPSASASRAPALIRRVHSGERPVRESDPSELRARRSVAAEERFPQAAEEREARRAAQLLPWAPVRLELPKCPGQWCATAAAGRTTRLARPPLR